MLDCMDRAFNLLEHSNESKPTFKRFSAKRQGWRFEEKNIYQAMILKLARLLSSLRASLVLVNHGFVQEQAVLLRTIEETIDDLMFFSYGSIADLTDLHKRYLSSFWDEEFDESGVFVNKRSRNKEVQRGDIRKYIARECANKVEAEEVMKTVYRVFSGYVHGASPHIMDMYFGKPPRFHTCGMRESTGDVLKATHALWHFTYVSFDCFYCVVIAFNSVGYCDVDVDRLLVRSDRYPQFVKAFEKSLSSLFDST